MDLRVKEKDEVIIDSNNIEELKYNFNKSRV
jgi:hypothetical protein